LKKYLFVSLDCFLCFQEEHMSEERKTLDERQVILHPTLSHARPKDVKPLTPKGIVAIWNDLQKGIRVDPEERERYEHFRRLCRMHGLNPTSTMLAMATAAMLEKQPQATFVIYAVNRKVAEDFLRRTRDTLGALP
jgi:hypothetical protein